MKNWFMNLSNEIKALIHIINAIIFVVIPIAIEGTTNVPLILLWLVNMVFGIIFIVWHAKSNKVEKEYIQTEEGQAKVENAEKLLKIAQANRVNPYVDITPFVLDYGFPFVNYNGFFCSDGEVVVYACPANVFKDKEQVVGYRGRSTGTSVRVAKGLYMRSGRSGSNAIRAEVRKYYNGDLIITNKRVVFIGKDESFECPVEKITATKLLTKSSFILQYGRTSKNIGVDINITEYAYGMINYVTNAYKDGEDVCAGVKQSHDDMTEEQKALCVRIKSETDQLKIPKSAMNSEGATPTAVKVIFAVIAIIFVGLLIASMITGCVSNNQDSEQPTAIESFALDYNYYDEDMTLVLGDDSGLFDKGDWDTLRFYVKPSNVEVEDIEIINSNNEVLQCWIKDSLNDPETHSLKVIIGYKGLKVGKSTFYLKDKNSDMRSCDITITVEEKESDTDAESESKYANYTVYVNFGGSKFHFKKSCAGASPTETSYGQALNMNKTPCSKCAMYLDQETHFIGGVDDSQIGERPSVSSNPELESCVANLCSSYNENWSQDKFDGQITATVSNTTVNVIHTISGTSTEYYDFQSGAYDDDISIVVAEIKSYFENNIQDMLEITVEVTIATQFEVNGTGS